jgi:site-specific DNA recombinase
MLYCREDRVLELVWHDEALHQMHPGLRTRVPEVTAAYLHEHAMILVGDEDGWNLESEDDRIVLTNTPGAAALAAKIPAQRDGDRV